MDHPKKQFANRLLRRLEPTDLVELVRHLEPVDLPVHMVLEEPGKPIPRVCFPDSGIVSVVARTKGDRRIEAGLVGPEGLTGSAIVLGDDRSPNETYVQVAGAGHWLSAHDMRSAIAASATLRRTCLAYVQAFLIQTTQTALANGRAKIDERLARWLVMAHDRLGAPELPLTHEFLSLMLGVRRPGVTEALSGLEALGLIGSKRGVVIVKHRKGLEKVADGSYGVAEAEYRRLLG